MSVHNRNMKHARAIEFDYTKLLAMLWTLLPNNARDILAEARDRNVTYASGQK